MAAEFKTATDEIILLSVTHFLKEQAARVVIFLNS
jgi:hypothetical protein